METDHHIEILLVEDRPGDARLIKEAFCSLKKPPKMHHAWDGAEALELLKDKNSYPGLILLDLDIPAIDGRIVLAQIKCDPLTRAIPIIVLAASHDPADVLLCYKLDVNCYLEKPANWDEFDYLATSVQRFWLRQ
jgi:chemotaxis family two-component system response regulator Rcp1